MAQTARLPDYPTFAPLVCQHRDLLAEALEAAQPEISELTFLYQWIWRPYTHCRVSCLSGTVVLAADSTQTGQPYFLPPITREPQQATELITSVLAHADTATSFERVPQTIADRLKEHDDLVLTEQRDRADYVYSADELRELPGVRFWRKRNHVRQFWAAYPHAEYVEMDDGLAQSCAQFCKDWLKRHPKRDLPGLRREVDTTLAMLDQWQWLGLSGGAMLCDGRLVAFALGESINRETFAVRVEKAEASVAGAYQAINQEFARRAGGRFRWVNREQDLGLPGLRRAKLSYHPHRLVRKYQVKLKR